MRTVFIFQSGIFNHWRKYLWVGFSFSQNCRPKWPCLGLGGLLAPFTVENSNIFRRKSNSQFRWLTSTPHAIWNKLTTRLKYFARTDFCQFVHFVPLGWVGGGGTAYTLVAEMLLFAWCGDAGLWNGWEQFEWKCVDKKFQILSMFGSEAAAGASGRSIFLPLDALSPFTGTGLRGDTQSVSARDPSI